MTTILNANDAKKVGGNPVTLDMPKGFSAEKASQIYGASNEAKSATKVIPSNPLPDEVPCSGPKTAGSASDSASHDTGDNELNIDIAGSSVTVFIMRKE